MITIPARNFTRGEVEEKRDSYGDFIVVKSVVEYKLDVSEIEQLALEIKAAGDVGLQIWLNGKLYDKEALAIPGTDLGLNDVPRWVRVGRPIDVTEKTKRIALVLRYDPSEGPSGVEPRRVYELRFTTIQGSGVPELRLAERKPWDHFSWLLERYPLSDTIQESTFLRPREPFQFDRTLPEHPTDYPDAISSDEYGYQVGNSFLRVPAVRRNQLTPSLGRFVFGPPATPEEKVTYYGYLTGELGEIELRSAEGESIKLEGTSLHFQPNHIETSFEAPGVQIKVDSAIDFNDMLEAKITLAADKPVALSLRGSASLPGKWWQQSGIWVGQTVFYFVLGFDVNSSVDAQIIRNEKPLGYRIEMVPSTQAELVMRLKPGYRVKDVRDALISQRKSPISVAQRSWQEFHDFFARIVPPFSCSDQRLVVLYNYIAYAVRLNVVDIPFEPYADPYLTYSKIAFEGLNMWPENVTTDMLYVRWFNDRSFGERILRKCHEYPGSPPLQPFTPPRKGYAWPYRDTVAAYEFAKCSDSPEFFDLIKKIVRATVEKPLENPFEGGALDGYDHMIPQYDFSLRYKPFTKGRVWWGSRMNQPLAHIDDNAWRYQLHRMAAAHARAADDSSAAQLEERAKAIREAINRLMWDDDVGFYFDYAVKDRKRSDVMSVAAFHTLWAEVPDRAKADRLVEHLTNPNEFWSRYVVPATSLADPRTNPRGYTDGGILLDVNNWFPFQGLLKMGYKDVAVELFWRTIDLMNTHGILTWACDNFTADDGSPMGAVCPDSGVVVDMILRCGTGFVPRTDELFEFDPLILGPQLESLDWGPYLYKKHWIQVHWGARGGDPKYPAGLTIIIDDARFHLVQPRHILLRLEKGCLMSIPVIPDPLEVRPDYD